MSDSAKKLSLNAFQIKLLACLFMLTDHTGILLVPHDAAIYVYMRMIGRLSFPLFAYMTANGYRHTSNVGKYLLRLLIFTGVMELINAFLLGSRHFNIFGTLALGLAAIALWEKLDSDQRISIRGAAAVILAAALAQLLKMDYGAYGVLLIFSCHLLYGRSAVLALVWIPLSLIGWKLGAVGQDQLLAVCALPILELYNNRPGPRGFWAKWGFYLFYCLHLPLLYGLSQL